jgi:hypothetical protein
MRPEPCKVQGSPALYVVQGGFRIGKPQSPSFLKASFQLSAVSYQLKEKKNLWLTAES